jgi:hypothetical protein
MVKSPRYKTFAFPSHQPVYSVYAAIIFSKILTMSDTRKDQWQNRDQTRAEIIETHKQIFFARALKHGHQAANKTDKPIGHDFRRPTARAKRFIKHFNQS